jgi:hypothetical protein
MLELVVEIVFIGEVEALVCRATCSSRRYSSVGRFYVGGRLSAIVTIGCPLSAFVAFGCTFVCFISCSRCRVCVRFTRLLR